MLAWAIKTKPMALAEVNYTLWINEAVVLLGSYLVLLFTDYVPEKHQQYTFGYMYITIFLGTTIMNILLNAIISVRDVKKFLRRRKF